MFSASLSGVADLSSLSKFALSPGFASLIRSSGSFACLSGEGCVSCCW